MWNPRASRIVLETGGFAPVFCLSCAEPLFRMREGSSGRRRILNGTPIFRQRPAVELRAPASRYLSVSTAALARKRTVSPENHPAKRRQRYRSLSAQTKSLCQEACREERSKCALSRCCSRCSLALPPVPQTRNRVTGRPCASRSRTERGPRAETARAASCESCW